MNFFKVAVSVVLLGNFFLFIELGFGAHVAVIPNGGEVVERLDVFDEEKKRVGYTVIRGDPRFKHVQAVMEFVPGPTAGTTTATWTATYVPMNEHASLDNRFCIAIWKALEAAAAKASS